MNTQKIKLGMKVKDLVSGYTGIAEHRADYLHGCSRYCIQAPVKEDGTVPKSYMVDEPQLEIIDAVPVIDCKEPEQLIELGLKIKDPVTDMTGVAYGRAVYINGCARMCIQPKKGSDGKIIQGNWFDEAQLEIVEPEPVVQKGDGKTGGPCPSIPTRDF